MKKNLYGFTLVELIVVIAIIGVLAAILVPSMLGYVKKSQIAAINSNAKSLSNAAATALTELDTEGLILVSGNTPLDFEWSKADADAGNQPSATAQQSMAAKVRKYFNGVEKLVSAYYRVNGSAILATAASNGSFYGTHPNSTKDDAASDGFAKNTAFSDSEKLLNWAQNASLT